MAAISSDQSGSKLNTELNLVPFIDLLSSLVLFLLVTEVWMQVGTITVSADSKGKAASAISAKATLYVHLTSKGYDLRLENAGAVKIPKSFAKVNGDYDAAGLVADLKEKLAGHIPNTAAISSDDDISYKHVIHAVDAMKQVGFPSVALSTD